MYCYVTYMTLYFIFFFFFNDPATTEIYTLSLHDALPISQRRLLSDRRRGDVLQHLRDRVFVRRHFAERSEEHTSELQLHSDLVCRLLLEKKKEIVIFKIIHCTQYKANLAKKP